MAENSKDDVKHAIAKGNAKRDYLLSDEDLKELNHETKDNPINKSYPPMKIFKLSEVKSKAVEVWGSLEKLEDEKTKRKQKKVNVETKNEEEKRKFWDCEEIYEPLKKYMDELKLPVVAKEVPPATKGLLDCDVILCYSDCMNSRPPGALPFQLGLLNIHKTISQDKQKVSVMGKAYLQEQDTSGG
ncbi:predicted protein [Nematostella vectensis]|uniref:XPA C-terminal domain-containing protein n=1 Tax=Nematostella vectensis TaxID=45351 RepID=A7SP61_NEMVE|nr:predicted protein [Nematostella vectensis]|eukprot:XP_001626608.1 predicted protein [Nematostella vectensis]